MNACQQWEHTIVEYVDGVCQPEAAQQLQAHLMTCEACASTVRQQLWLKEAAAQLPREHAPAYLSRRIRHHARASLRRRGAVRFLGRASVATAVAAAAVLALWWGTVRSDRAVLLPAEEPTVAQAIVQEYVGAISNDGFHDPSLQLLARETQMKTLPLEPTAQ
jgi:anti-sigma factor RsiW